MSKVVDLRGKKPKPIARVAVRKANERPRRESPARARRLKRHGLKLSAIAILAVGFSWAVSVATYAPSLLISRFDVEGISTLSPGLVEAAAQTALYDGSWYIAPNNLFVFSKEKMTAAIKALPRVKTVSVSRASMLAQAVTITVEERAPYARWCVDTECYLLDDDGFIFARDMSETRAVETFFSGGFATGTSPIGKTYAEGHFLLFRDLIRNLEEKHYRARTLALEEGKDFSAVIASTQAASSSPFTIRASSDVDAKTLVRNLELALQSDTLRDVRALDYIDLRFGNRVYFKMVDSHE